MWLVFAPFTEGPLAIAWSCVSVVVLWLWMRRARADEKRPRRGALLKWLLGSVVLAAVLAVPVGRIRTYREGWQRSAPQLMQFRAIGVHGGSLEE